MPRNSPRPSPVREATTLITATVSGIAAVFSYYALVGNVWIYDVRNMILSFVLPFSCMIQLARVRPRRSLRRGLCCQAGFTAALAVAVTFVTVAIVVARKWEVWKPGRHLDRFVFETLIGLDDSAPLAIAATWLVLVLAGRWRLGRSWSDRLGTLLAVFWLSLPVLDLYIFTQ